MIKYVPYLGLLKQVPCIYYVQVCTICQYDLLGTTFSLSMIELQISGDNELLWIWPLYLHVNQKSDDDDDE